MKHLPLDLSDRSSLEGTLAKAPGVTHLFFCAFQATGDYLKDVEVNFGMFKALVEASEAAGHKLKHVHFVSGTKWYGRWQKHLRRVAVLPSCCIRVPSTAMLSFGQSFWQGLHLDGA